MPEDDRTSAAPEEAVLSRRNRLEAFVGVGTLLATTFIFAAIPAPVATSQGIGADKFNYHVQAVLRVDVLLAGAFLAAFCLAPAGDFALDFLRRRWRDWHTYTALAGICIFLSAVIIHVGRWQYGGFDFNILIETGWRQILGQRPYVDFPTTTPPGFNLGAKYAFDLFGVNWDANLYFTAVFASATFLWMYWLLRVLSLGGVAAAGMAFAVECAGVLTLCFWWYNDSVLTLAAVFFLACLAYARRPESTAVQVSFLSSLALLSLMKPNIAGMMIVGGVVLLFVATDRKVRLVALTLGATAAAILLLVVNHVSIPAMLSSYVRVAEGRGGIGARFGYREMSTFEKHSALFWMAVVSIPLLGLVPKAFKQLVNRDWKGIALSLLFPLSLIVGVYGLLTNGEYRDVECTVLLAAGAVLSFGTGGNGLFLRRLYVAIVFAMMVGDLYYGAERLRVYGIGPHMFFEWRDNRNLVDSGFLKDMRVSSTMIEVEREVALAKDGNPGPYFFGPRLDFNYAVFGLPSPDHFPAWWHPGTAFGLAEESGILKAWQAHQFATLIFLKRNDTYGIDHTYYPPEFLDAITRGYVEDDSYASITIYHRRQIGSAFH